ncbi:MAG: 6-phosphogluconolactonase [Chloroflexi bacterium]|nr:6-phosphogluconolactonase [Chloroflexota bacterium]MBI1855013.1 6-phosphogluconolactonase [Chloroflexota bacterium]MBI3341298.1 6-phosphogluconolactonase [Chloroflexota bacterium]
MTNLNPEVRIFADLETLSAAAALLFIESSARAIMERGRFLTAFSGGSTPLKLYKLLAQSPYREQVDWPRVHVFWGDERCVPPEDLENNYRQAHDVLLGYAPIPTGNIHRVQSDLEPETAALNYALVLKQFASAPLDWPRFDLVLLGMGNDGHTASLFPGSEVDVSTATLAVTAQYQGRPANRVTLTPRVFNAARQIVFLVSGESKSEMLANVLYGEYRPEQLPAQRIRPADGELTWMVDQSAAGKLW